MFLFVYRLGVKATSTSGKARSDLSITLKKRSFTSALVVVVTALALFSRMSVAAGKPAHSYTVTTTTASKWMRGYLKAWETRDADAVEKLFTPGGVYESIPGVDSETFVGRKTIHKYWFAVTREQSNIHGAQGSPIVSGNRAAIEIWVTFRDPEYNAEGDHMVTLLETNVVTFVRGGLASKNAEYWNILHGVHSPPAGWGKAAG
jgi:ketosteroid isomerase-like protein